MEWGTLGYHMFIQICCYIPQTRLCHAVQLVATRSRTALEHGIGHEQQAPWIMTRYDLVRFRRLDVLFSDNLGLCLRKKNTWPVLNSKRSNGGEK